MSPQSRSFLQRPRALVRRRLCAGASPGINQQPCWDTPSSPPRCPSTDGDGDHAALPVRRQRQRSHAPPELAAPGGLSVCRRQGPPHRGGGQRPGALLRPLHLQTGQHAGRYRRHVEAGGKQGCVSHWPERKAGKGQRADSHRLRPRGMC